MMESTWGQEPEVKGGLAKGSGTGTTVPRGLQTKLLQLNNTPKELSAPSLHFSYIPAGAKQGHESWRLSPVGFLVYRPGPAGPGLDRQLMKSCLVRDWSLQRARPRGRKNFAGQPGGSIARKNQNRWLLNKAFPVKN